MAEKLFIFLLWSGLLVVIGRIAESKNRSVTLWIVLAALFSHLFSLPILLLLLLLPRKEIIELTEDEDIIELTDELGNEEDKPNLTDE
jgi:hypothetical protein